MGAPHEHSGFLLEKGEMNVARHGLRHLLAVEFLQLCFRVEKIDLAYAPFHVEENALLCFRREVRWPQSKGIRATLARLRREKAIRLE
jgi:hypothetical protein